MEPHPDTGARYVIVFPNAPTFDLLWNEHLYLDETCPWLRVVEQSKFGDYFALLRDERAVLLLYAPPEDLSIPPDKKCVVSGMYFEAYDQDLALLAPDHRRAFDRFIQLPLDAVGCHTPWMASEIGKHSNKPSFVLPHGWSSLAGYPDDTRKNYEGVFYGSMVGKRGKIFPWLQTHDNLLYLAGVYGCNLLRKIDEAKTVLNIYHYNVQSYSTHRMFQAAHTSAALVTEPGDIWPLSKGNYYEIPRVETEGDVEELIAYIEDIPHEEALATAKRAHDELKEYSVERCVEEFFVEGTKELLR